MALPKTFTGGERLFAADLNSNFENLDARTVGAEFDIDTLQSDVTSLGSRTTALENADPLVFNTRTVITATDASWSVPSLANPHVKVTCVGAGGGGSDSGSSDGGGGGTTSFGAYLSATGGSGGDQTDDFAQNNGTPGWASANGGTARTGGSGSGGHVDIAYVSLGGVSTVNVTIGAGGAGQ